MTVPYLGNWYQTLNLEWRKFGPILTIYDSRLGWPQHIELAERHFSLATCEKQWRNQLHLVLDWTGDLNTLPSIFQSVDAPAKKASKQSVTAIIAASWKLSLARQLAHQKCCVYHQKEAERKRK